MAMNVPFSVTPCYAKPRGDAKSTWKPAVLYVTQTRSRLYVWDGHQLAAVSAREDWAITWHPPV